MEARGMEGVQEEKKKCKVGYCLSKGKETE